MLNVINRDRRISIQETTWRCSYIAKKFMIEDDKNRRREGGIRVPECQREWAWKVKKGVNKLEQLIDSIFHNYPIPSAILNEMDSNGITDYEVFDGRHRFETIWRFINNKFSYQGKYYKDLTSDEKEKFDSREMPVTIAQNASLDQLADIFIRLNSGAPLTDSDMFWAHRESSLVKQTRKLVCANKQLSEVFGGQDMTYRKDLANWVGLVYGLSTRNSGNMTTSYLRISESKDEDDVKGLEHEVDEAYVRQGLEAVRELYENANKEIIITKAEQKKYKKLGLVNAFFLSEWMEASPNARQAIIRKWTNIVLRLRSDETREDMLDVLKAPGAQNLTSIKIERVLKRVNDYLEEQPFEEETDFVENDDEDSTH
jgi:hypothetical protein